ncbi:MAG: LacI family DNA-binding transcriptional regulator [Candidatus Eisenbacteria bacterium]|nr:LacI family DNA-binding transcriptional regulator [Candidatus Eisenbacteria bacterium]
MATIRDVAREAGVSIATVSRVYNKTALVSEETAQHVRAVASRMDYWPNGAARSLITNRTHAIGVLLPDLYGEFFSEVIRGIDLAARRERFQVLVSSSHADNDALVSAVRSMRGRIDGLIAMAPDARSVSAVQGFTRNFPIVLIDPGREVGECGAIAIANYDGAYEMVRHLHGLGHRSIATVRGPVGNFDAEERLRGYRDAMRDCGADSAPVLEIQGDFTESSGYRAAAELLHQRPRPSAVFAANDYMAIGLIGALRDAGFRVPQDVAVTGFDDIAIAQYLTPPLTTVRVDAYELGERAVQQLLPMTRAKKSEPQPLQLLPTKLVIRSSCGSLRPEPVDAWSRRGRGRPMLSSG